MYFGLGRGCASQGWGSQSRADIAGHHANPTRRPDRYYGLGNTVLIHNTVSCPYVTSLG